MAWWTVMLKTDEGTQYATLEAEVAMRSDDGKQVDFYRFEALKDAFESFEALSKDLPKEESLQNFERLLKAISKFRVASFKVDSVIGFFQGEAAQGQ